MKIEELWIYPIKSCRGHRVQSARVLSTGLEHDRRSMIVGTDGKFLSQRALPQMARLSCEISCEDLILRYDATERQPVLVAEVDPTSGTPLEVQVWSDQVHAVCYPKSVNDWISEQLGHDLRLVKLAAPDARRRQVKTSGAPFVVSFADDYPVLLANRTSHEHLREVWGLTSPLDRFRANIIVSSGEPFSEESWNLVWSESVRWGSLKPCTRCTVVDVDQSTGNIPKDTLRVVAQHAQMHRSSKATAFGIHMIPETLGVLRQGEELYAH